MKNLRSRLGLVAAMVMALALGAMPAFAQTDSVGSVNTAVSDGASDATSIVTTNIPVILGVAVLWVALKYGKRILAKF